MNKIFTLILTTTLMFKANSQVMLNEIYCIPSPGRHEFFELFNNGTGPVPISMDNYTIITYFEEPGNKGFYVLDLPNIPVPSQSYFVGAAAIPFNYQGVINSNTAQFSWNDVAFLAANNGYLKKWVMATTVPAAVDGNADYDLQAIPANFNDFFFRKGGGNASYNVFLYKNGNLANCFLGGIGGSTSMPSYIMAMPTLNVDMVADAPDFSVEWSGYTNTPFESVIQEVGTDNGYIRLRDGFCGTWDKSSATVNHTPGITNGGSTFEAATISVAAVVVPGNELNGSEVVYDVVGAPVTSFPITMQILTDVGTSPTLLDAGDNYIGESTETVITDGPFYTNFHPYNEHILIVVYTGAGCIDRIMAIPNTGVLPVKISSFKASHDADRVHLNWEVESNELAHSFELQSAPDGKNFKTVKTVSGTGKEGSENYSCSVSGGSYFRIKIKETNQKISYSNIVYLDEKETPGKLVVLSGPEDQTIRFRYNSAEKTTATVSVYNASGARIISHQVQLVKGQQQVILPALLKTGTGIYIMEVSTLTNRQACRFVKR